MICENDPFTRWHEFKGGMESVGPSAYLCPVLCVNKNIRTTHANFRMIRDIQRNVLVLRKEDKE